jgi:hypothetical protein
VGNGGDTVGKLMTKIRQKLCRHTRLEFDAWHHEDGKWFIYGTCVYCGAKWRGISFTDSCAKELKDVMDREG